jgi:alkanesulfonate monooxygenase SsuD/methylene tetrahydromethanopterin reductase-like flavin-dependent oxidoreductase (luciferase family)
VSVAAPAVSLILPVHGVQPGEVLAAARAAERAGLAGLWVPDHLHNPGRPTAGVLECLATLSIVAAASERIRVGTLVLSTPFRHPPLLAKQVASIEAAAPGRLVLGLGAGGMTYASTCAQLGFVPLAPGERVAHVEETVACLRALWRDDPADFAGRFARASGARIHPRPARPIQIVLAARGPRMLALAARVADGWNCPLPHELEPGLAALERHGRARHTIDVSAFAVAVLGESEADARRALARAGPAAQRFGDVEAHHVFGAPERAAARLLELGRLGAREVALDVRGLPAAQAVELLSEQVLPRLAHLRAT